VKTKQQGEWIVQLGEQSVTLLKERAVWMAADRILIVADLHFGKVNHFRRAGLPVPLKANHRNAECLIELIQQRQPATTYFLGDLLHSTYNDDWEVIGQIVKHFPECRFELIRGNHDILSEQQYRRHGIEVRESCRIGKLLLTHEPVDPAGDGINLSGHLHPAARLVGKGRQSIMLPCFWYSHHRFILPAFGSFTGLAAISPAEGDSVYLVTADKIVEMRSPSSDQGLSVAS
jgi:DNA ligase-associated metallophosphoesterase